MALTPNSDNLDVIAGLADLPNDEDGLTAAQFKAKFDQGPKALQTFINNMITEIETQFETKTDLTTTRKLSATGNFTGSWFGLTNPTASEPGIQNQVNALIADTAQRRINVKYPPAGLDAAVGDGTTDDLTALQAIMDYLDDLGGGTMFFPNGTYLIKGKQTALGNDSRLTDGLVLKSNIILEGDNSSIIRSDPKSCFSLDTAIRTAVTDSTDNAINNITIRNLTFDKPSATWFEQSHLINIGTCTNLLIENCRFTGWSGDAICLGAMTNEAIDAWLQSWIENVTIRNCVFDGIGNTNRQAISAITGKNIHIVNNVFKNTTRSDMPGAIDFEPEGTWAVLQDIFIQDNRFDNIGGNVGAISFVNAYDIIFKNVFMDRNIIRDTDAYAFSITDIASNTVNVVNNIHITNNKVDAATRFISLNGANTVRVKNNTVLNITFPSTIGDVSSNSHIDFDDNRIIDCKDVTNLTAFINVYNVNHLNIKRNTIVNGGYTIITFLTDSPNSITNVRVVENELIDCTDTTNFLLKQTTDITGMIFENNLTSGKAIFKWNTRLDNNGVGISDLPDDLAMGTFKSVILENSTGLPSGETTGILMAMKYTMDTTYRNTVIELFYPWAATGGDAFYMRTGASSSSNTWTSWYKFTGA